VRTLVGGARLCAFAALTALGGVALVPFGARGRRRLFRLWSRAVLRLLGVRVRVLGTAPASPVALVSNHLSYLDVLVLCASLSGDVSFVAKADVAGWPAFGRLAAAVGTIFIDRTRKRDLLRVLPRIEAQLVAGDTVVFFPEATSSPGHEVLRFRSPLFQPPLRAARPVVAAALHYATRAGDPPAATSVCWWGDMEFAPHLFGLMKLRGVDATIEFCEELLWADDRKALARRAQGEVVKRRRAPRDLET
jgi:1-acyl-sn-glycerol-3-phosphate acyltransferase